MLQFYARIFGSLLNLIGSLLRLKFCYRTQVMAVIIFIEKTQTYVSQRDFDSHPAVGSLEATIENDFDYPIYLKVLKKGMVEI